MLWNFVVVVCVWGKGGEVNQYGGRNRFGISLKGRNSGTQYLGEQRKIS